MSKVLATVAMDNNIHSFQGNVSITAVATRKSNGFKADVLIMGTASTKEIAALMSSMVTDSASKSSYNNKIIELFMLVDIKAAIDQRLEEHNKIINNGGNNNG